MATGAICVNTLKKDWTVATTLAHVLSVVRCLLIVPFPESSLNDEAGKLFMESYEEYSKRARLMADVHGRRRQDGDDDDDGKVSPNTKAARGVLVSSSDSTNNTVATTNTNATTTAAAKKVAPPKKTKAPLGKLGKKKSLKRL